MLFEVHERRGRIEGDLGSRHAIPESAETIRPRMEDGDARRASLGGRALQIVHPPQELDTLVTKGGAEHAVAGKEDRLKIARDQGVGASVGERAG